MSEAASRKPAPKALAMVICDQVIEDKGSGKKTLIGLFNNIQTGLLPCTHPHMNVYVALTDGHGEYQIALRCLNLDDETQIMEMKGPIRFDNPRQIMEFNFEIGGLKLPAFGNYRFDLMCNEELVISRKFGLTQAKKGPEA